MAESLSALRLLSWVLTLVWDLLMQVLGCLVVPCDGSASLVVLVRVVVNRVVKRTVIG